MPNFHMHWLTALEAINGFDPLDDIATGKNLYFARCRDFRTSIYSTLAKVREPSSVVNAIVTLAAELEKSLREPKAYDQITCFSAYMLGACGPDFWTLMSKESFPPDEAFTAGLHFDLGHYNRTHQQFIVSGGRLRSKAPSSRSLNDRVERAYFAGMATHVATDCVLHELVNVYAGAYNILSKTWYSEHGSTRTVAKLWSTHNKVEHYWDTYVRYRWLGDYGPVWNDDGVIGGPAPLRLPLADTLVREARRAGKHLEPALFEYESRSRPQSIDELMAADESVEASLAGPAYYVEAGRETLKAVRSSPQYKENTKKTFVTKATYLLERPINFPRIFCDRMLARDGLSPFIHEVVVKDGGAYPSGDVFDAITREKTSAQMNDDLNGGQNEGNKLRTFSSRVNMGDNFNSFNFQAYFMGPRLERLQEYGPTVFWEPKALPAFIRAATEVARTFATSYMNYADKERDDLGALGHFWNLDTGLGLKVQYQRSRSSRETRTRLKFVHVTEATRTAIEHARQDEHLGSKKAAQYDIPGRYAFDPKSPPFDVLDGDIFPSTNDIYESSPPRYLRSLVTENDLAPVMHRQTLDEFFGRVGAAPSPSKVLVPTNGIATGTQVELSLIANRLSLEIEASIVTLGPKEVTGYALLSDRKGKDAVPQEHAEHACALWLDKANSQCLRMLEQTVASPDVLVKPLRVHYTSRIFANLDPESALFGERKSAKGEWNNVITLKDVETYCGKNYAVGTLRKNVLKQDGTGRFWADRDFKRFTDLVPTEQVFFTLFALVSANGECYDAFSKATVTRDDFEKMRKIRCVGFVPIVLLYSQERDGFAQLDTCYIDGLRVPVEEVAE